MKAKLVRLRSCVLAGARWASRPAAATTPSAGQARRRSRSPRPGRVEGELTISNWPGYIDPGKDGSVAEFEDETGVSVEYIEDINSNLQFFGKLQPLLDQGESGGRDIFVVTDWMAKQMYDLGYLQEINPDDIPTVVENLAPQFESEGSYDPDHKFSIPWQGGMTGVWVNTSEPDSDAITSVNDLFDPKYKGRVTMLDEMRDTVPLVMQGDGVDTTEATKEDWLAAIDKIDAGRRLRPDPPRHRQRVHRGPDQRQRRRLDRLVRRRVPDRQRRRRVAPARRGLQPLVRQDGDPGRRAEHRGGARVHELRLRARGAGRHRRVRQLRDAGRRGEGDPRQARSEAGREPAHLPRRGVHGRLLAVHRSRPETTRTCRRSTEAFQDVISG